MVEELGGQKRWQREQRERRKKKNLFFLRLCLVVFAFLVFVGLAYKIIVTFSQSRWSGTGRINFVTSGQEIVLVSYEPNDQSLTLFLIPRGTQLELTRGFGKYRIEALIGLEKQEKRKDLLSETIQENLALPISGEIKTAKTAKIEDDSGKKMVLTLLGQAIIGQNQTNLSLWDLLRLWWQINKIHNSQTRILNPENLNLLSPIILPDESRVWEINPGRFDDLVPKFFADSSLKKQRLTVEVLNGTNHPGLAEKVARLLTNVGVEVVSVGNSQESQQQCLARSSQKLKSSNAVKAIMRIYRCVWQENKEEGRADLTLIIGEEYWQKLSQK